VRKQASKPPSTQVCKQAHSTQASKLAGKWTSKKVDRQAGKQANKQAGKWASKQPVNKQASR